MREKDEAKHVHDVAHAQLAPAIQGAKHISSATEFYIPCRILKNVSYGAMPVTNNPGVKTLLEQHCSPDVAARHIICNRNLERLLDECLDKLRHTTAEQFVADQLTLMEAIRDHHTYIHRIADLIRYGLGPAR